MFSYKHVMGLMCCMKICLLTTVIYDTVVLPQYGNQEKLKPLR